MMDERSRFRSGMRVFVRIPSGRRTVGDVLVAATVLRPYAVAPPDCVDVRLGNGEERAIHVSRVQEHQPATSPETAP